MWRDCCLSSIYIYRSFANFKSDSLPLNKSSLFHANRNQQRSRHSTICHALQIDPPRGKKNSKLYSRHLYDSEIRARASGESSTAIPDARIHAEGPFMVSLIRILCSTPVCIRNWLPRSRIAGIAAGHIDPKIPVTRATPRLTMIDPPPPSILPRFMEQYTRRSNLRCSLRVDFFQRLGVVGRERRGEGGKRKRVSVKARERDSPGARLGDVCRASFLFRALARSWRVLSASRIAG